MDRIVTLGLTATLIAALFCGSHLARAETTSLPVVEQGVIGGSVSRATFTSSVVNREPIDKISELRNDQRYVYFFSELKGMTGRTISHRWEYGGKIMSETKFDVGAPRWRAWSGTTLFPEQTGEWTVSVINDLGETIYSAKLQYLDKKSP
ncbi:MAG: DUF2914 domain-containing protein [Gammaproteobacteria bacterium]|nr:DUF2914 domain-containing protein [Gammaproteobacteria bacterium]